MKTHSIRFKFFAFLMAILLILLLLLNTYPIISSRDTVFQEKNSAMTTQGSVVSSALGGLEKLTRDGVTDVFRFLDMGNYDRIVVADETGTVIYDDGSGIVAATTHQDGYTATDQIDDEVLDFQLFLCRQCWCLACCCQDTEEVGPVIQLVLD